MKLLKKTWMLCALAMLAGCGEGSGSADQRPASTPQASQQGVLHKNAIHLPSGENLDVAGRLRSYNLLSNEQGDFDRYVFESPEDLMALEGQIYSTLAKRGYVRKIKSETPGLFVVRYAKRNAPSIMISYETRQNGTAEFKTQMKINWKNS